MSSLFDALAEDGAAGAATEGLSQQELLQRSLLFLHQRQIPAIPV
jgi:hypothetical protein